MIDRTIPNGVIGRCDKCGGEELFEDGRFYCYEDCRKTSGPVHGEVAGPEQAS